MKLFGFMLMTYKAFFSTSVWMLLTLQNPNKKCVHDKTLASSRSRWLYSLQSVPKRGGHTHYLTAT